ncbi:hypothetical protein PEC18_39385 [Paucibacter sp. O1-1]|nr:hypothetical protein [Paucibacter sp. O1-1]MDA3831677.1 hypothetical protein [Paucibacter sp. O1-1]
MDLEKNRKSPACGRAHPISLILRRLSASVAHLLPKFDTVFGAHFTPLVSPLWSEGLISKIAVFEFFPISPSVLVHHLSILQNFRKGSRNNTSKPTDCQ